MKLSAEFRGSLDQMAYTYHHSLLGATGDGPAARAKDYLSSRGVGLHAIISYQLGVVDGSYDDHEHYKGMVVIPYKTRLGGTVSLKFRRSHDCSEMGCEHSKYITPYPTRLYNTLAMDVADRTGTIALVEGELNAITLTEFCALPAVGIPGVETWTAHKEWPALFAGYHEVLMFPDDDEAGWNLAEAVKRQIDTVRIVRLPDGMDANQAYVTIGAERIREIANVG